MSVDLFVARGQADKVGQDVVDVLISETSVALKRGQNELDEQGGYFSNATMEVSLAQTEKVGDLLQLQDFRMGVQWRGKIKAISHNVAVGDDGTVTAATSFTIQRKLA